MNDWSSSVDLIDSTSGHAHSKTYRIRWTIIKGVSALNLFTFIRHKNGYWDFCPPNITTLLKFLVAEEDFSSSFFKELNILYYIGITHFNFSNFYTTDSMAPVGIRVILWSHILTIAWIMFWRCIFIYRSAPTLQWRVNTMGQMGFSWL